MFKDNYFRRIAEFQQLQIYFDYTCDRMHTVRSHPHVFGEKVSLKIK